ncbi:hypothetical protein D3C81_762000 [compost metagenome]
MDRHQLAPQGLQLRIQHLAHPGVERLPGEFGRRRHKQHIALLVAGQALAAQHQIQRLVPRHVLQAQGDAALHRVAGDQVHTGVISQHLQHGAHLHILKVQRQRLTPVGRC